MWREGCGERCRTNERGPPGPGFDEFTPVSRRSRRRGSSPRRDRPGARARRRRRARPRRGSDLAVEREHDADELLRVLVKADLADRPRPLVPPREREADVAVELLELPAEVPTPAWTLPSAVRSTRCPIRNVSTQRHVSGRSCITPTAPTDDTTWFWKPDSIHASARASLDRRRSAPTSGRAQRARRPCPPAGLPSSLRREPEPLPPGHDHAVERQAVVTRELPRADVVPLRDREEALAWPNDVYRSQRRRLPRRSGKGPIMSGAPQCRRRPVHGAVGMRAAPPPSPGRIVRPHAPARSPDVATGTPATTRPSRPARARASRWPSSG